MHDGKSWVQPYMVVDSHKAGMSSHDMRARRLPNIFLLDLDATVFGDVASVLTAWELRDLAVRVAPTATMTGARPLDFGPAFRTGLLRPGFADFYDGIKRLLPHTAEFFVYTAGSDEWATIVVAQLERHLGRGRLFRRPLLTCDTHCILRSTGPYPVVKSLEKVYPAVLLALQHDYPAMRTAGAGTGTSDRRAGTTMILPVVMRPQIVFIDDREGNLPGDGLAVQRRQVVCPPYKATPSISPYDTAVAGLPAAVLRLPEIKDFLQRRRLSAAADGLLAASVVKRRSARHLRWAEDSFFDTALIAISDAVSRTRARTRNDDRRLIHVSISDRVVMNLSSAPPPRPRFSGRHR